MVQKSEARQTLYPVKRDKDDMHYTYLDTVGRPVVTLHKSNLVEAHILDFDVSTCYLSISSFSLPIVNLFLVSPHQSAIEAYAPLRFSDVKIEWRCEFIENT